MSEISPILVLLQQGFRQILSLLLIFIIKLKVLLKILSIGHNHPWRDPIFLMKDTKLKQMRADMENSQVLLKKEQFNGTTNT